MADNNKNIDEKVEDLEAAKEKYLSENTVISIGGYEFTPAKLMVAFTLVSSILGGLYGVFEVYKDYQGMKKKIAEYVTPDLTEIYKKMEVLDANTSKMVEYTESIKRDVDGTVKEIKRDVDATLKDINRELVKNQKEQQAEIRALRADVDNKIKKALDNPLNN